MCVFRGGYALRSDASVRKENAAMSIDIKKEKLFPLSKAAKLKQLPRRRAGKKIHPATLYRWSSPGLRGCQLEVVQVGGTTCTSIEALQRFFAALTAAQTGGVPPSQTRPSADVGVDDAVEQRLDQLRF
jgi:hypothetical protein